MLKKPAVPTTVREASLSESIDISFSVPFVHRLRVTDDVASQDFDKLLGVLESGGSGPAKVLMITESSLQVPAQRIANRLRSEACVELVAAPVSLDGGEEVKNSTAATKTVLEHINAANLDRRSYVVAIGGGAMLDAVGYAASVAHRGIRLVRLPSTTLAQADSGVGVKNAINYFDKKNWVGTFAVPWAVINDTALLSSLSDRDFRSGFSEAVKVSLLKDRHEFRWLCDHAARVRDRETAIAKKAILRSCQSHLRHITAGGDPFEMREARPLDFGHWSAHRLEPISNYKIRHGEAVGIGVAIDCIYSSLKYGFPEAEVRAVCDCLATLGIPLWHDCLLPADRLLQGLEEFRQHLGGRLTITMLRDVGDPINVHEIDTSAMLDAIDRLAQISHGSGRSPAY
jgi:3-dehydroquinate synthase